MQTIRTYLFLAMAGSVQKFAIFKPVGACPPGSSMVQYGHGDGGKWVCSPFHIVNKLPALIEGQEECIVYSIGSFNQYDFGKIGSGGPLLHRLARHIKDKRG